MNALQRHHHGNILVGRIVVAVACLLILAANALLFKDAAAPIHPFPVLEVITVISLLWMFTGAWLMCTRKSVGRFLVLIILYLGSLGFFLTGVIGAATYEPALEGRLKPFFIATAIYLFVSLVLTHSKHVQRLTSRMWE